MNSSSASRATGVRSFQLNGTPVWSGVVKRLESVMMIVWASPDLAFTYVKPSAPAPPALFTTTSGRGESLYLSTRGAIRRAIWSAPPPVPAGTTNSTGFVGSHAAAGAARLPIISAIPRSATETFNDRWAMGPPWVCGLGRWARSEIETKKGAASDLAAPPLTDDDRDVIVSVSCAGSGR
jgi:hypothetical protein